MKARTVLNWYAKNPGMILGLRGCFSPVKGGFFSTIRLGTKWAGKLKRNDYVAISVSNDPSKPRVIGHASVEEVCIKTIRSLNYCDLKLNIGAKTHRSVLRDMRKVYGKEKVNENSVVTVLWLDPVR